MLYKRITFIPMAVRKSHICRILEFNVSDSHLSSLPQQQVSVFNTGINMYDAIT
jgi:hypothetical protein